MLRSAQNICRYVYVDSVRTYEIPFPYWSKTDISAVLTVNGNDQPLSTDSYTVSEPGDYGILTINSDFVAPAGTSKLTIVRTVSIVQDMDYRNGDPINADNIEESLDALTAMLQQIDEKTARTVQLPVSEDAQTYVMPGTNERKGKVLGFDENGENFKAYKNPNEAIGEISIASSSMESGAANIIQFTKLSGATFMVPFYNGQKGDKGDKGEQGIQGVKGDTGATGVGISSIIQTITSAEDDGDNVITVTLSNGQTATFTIQNGSKGSQGIQGIQGAKGDKGDRGLQGPQGAQGERGEPFAISKTYPSVAAMNAGYASDGVLFGQFVLIDTGNVEDEDNAKLYVKGSTSYSYITDLSGSPGIKGDQGPQGIQGPKGEKGDKGDKGEQGIQGIQGAKGDKGDTGEQGVKGDTGATGVGISSIIQTTTSTEDDGDNVITVTLSNGQTATFTIQNGSKGSQGIQGIQGPKGEKGDKGDKGEQGIQGIQGAKGDKGDKGDTPDISNIYTKSEVDAKLELKSNTGHKHTKSEITDFPSSMPASDVYAWAKASSKPTYTASEVGAVPTTRTVNGKALSGNISLTASDVGASASGHTHSYAPIPVYKTVSSVTYGSTNGSYYSIAVLPSLSVGQIAFVKIYGKTNNSDHYDSAYGAIKTPSGGTYFVAPMHSSHIAYAASYSGNSFVHGNVRINESGYMDYPCILFRIS